MKKILNAGNRYLKSMNFADMAALKLCLISLGILIGLFIPSKSKKCTSLLMGLLFGSTYIPMLGKYISVLKEPQDD